jgi:hypothetical protein
VDEAGLYQKLGEITASLDALSRRFDRMENRLEKIESLDVLTARLELVDKEIGSIKNELSSIKTLPAKVIWAVVLSLAAGLGGLVIELVRG